MVIQREKNIYYGQYREIAIYPVYESGKALPTRKPKSKPSRKEQEQLNAKNAVKNFIWRVNGNFNEDDIVVHLTYDDAHLPHTYERVKMDLRNYLERIKRIRAREGLPALKWMAVIESTVRKRTGEVRWHIHLLMSEMSRKAAEKAWGKGTRVNADRLQPDMFGLEGIARYMMKNPCGRKRYLQSKNIEPPKISKPKDGKHTRTGVRRMATLYRDDAAYFERKYPGYDFLSLEVEQNQYNGYLYLSIKMKKRR